MSKLEGDGQSIGSIEHHDDQVLVFMNGIIDELQDGLVTLTPDINLEGLKIGLGVDKTVV